MLFMSMTMEILTTEAGVANTNVGHCVPQSNNVGEHKFPSEASAKNVWIIAKQNRLSNKGVIHDRRVASKWVHVERLSGLTKTFKILATKRTPNEIALGSQIMFLCFMLCCPQEENYQIMLKSTIALGR